MIYQVPMPSPSGRNRERLYLNGAPARAIMAMDAMPRRGRDADLIPKGGYRTGQRRDEDGDFGVGRDQDDGLDQIKVFLKNRLDPQNYAKLEAMIEALGPGGEGEQGEEQSPADDPRQEAAKPPPNVASDRPPSFRGMPRPGGQAQDSRGDSYHDFFGNRGVQVWER
jgi:hypothetical protein